MKIRIKAPTQFPMFGQMEMLPYIMDTYNSEYILDRLKPILNKIKMNIAPVTYNYGGRVPRKNVKTC